MTISITSLSKYSWFKIETGSMFIHIDPGYAGYFRTQRIPESELKDKADLVLVTHFHKDHLQAEALSKIRGPDTIILAPKRCAERIEGSYKIVKPGDKIKIGDINIRVIDAYNTLEGNSTRKLHHKRDGVGYLLEIEGKTVYHAGDTDFIPEMKHLGLVDVALLPIGGTFTMDITEALEAALTINSRIVIPMHISKADPAEFKKKLKSKSDIHALTLKIGEIYNLK